MEYYNGSVYLFSGKHVDRGELTFFNQICQYKLNDDLSPAQWVLLDSNRRDFNTTRGGSCVHQGFLYTFFGIDIENEIPIELSSIARVNLSNPESGWTELESSGCSKSIEARDSFGYYYSDGSVYINGGLSGNTIENSMIKLTLNNFIPTVQCTLLLENNVWPGRRNGASLVYIAGGLYLFGGQEKGTIFSDFYVFNLTTLNWQKLTTYGDIPSARYRHSAANQGKYMIISGGIGIENELLNDYYIYETETFRWTQIEAVPGTLIPPPVFSSCLTINFPKLYTVGGAEDTHITNSLWEFDLKTNEFKLLYNFNSKTDTGFFGHGCNIEKDSYNNLIINTYFGSTSINYIPYCAITQYNLSESQIRPKIISFDNTSFPCRVDNAYSVINSQYLLIAGGQRFEEEFLNDVWILNKKTLETYQLQEMENSVYSSAFTYFNNTLYMFSGYLTNGLAAYSPSNDFFIKIELDSENIPVPGLDFACGNGMGLVNGVCQLCPFGTYNDNFDSSICLSCPLGTYNQELGSSSIYQCIPCPYSTYSNKIAAISCSPCPSDKSCFIGTSSLGLSDSDVKELKDFREYKDQPKLYEPPNVLDVRFYLWVTVAAFIVVFTIWFIFDYRLRIFLSYNDIYKNMHIEMIADEQGNPIPKPTVIESNVEGGYFTVVTIVLLIAIGIDSIYSYAKTNIRQQIVLVPIDTLIEKKNFDDNSLKATLMFSSYRGECSFEYLNFSYSENIKVESKSVEYSDPFCTFHYDLKTTDIVETDDFIQFYFNDSSAYTSDINIRLRTHSSIPDKDSAVSQYLATNNNQVFRGYSYSEFYYTFLPAFYKESELFTETSKLGYYLSVSKSPKAGTQIDPRELGMNSGLGVKINFNQTEVGISTFKGPKEELIDFVFTYSADFPGTIVMFGFILWVYEFFFYLLKGKTSGRRRLIAKHIQREKDRRAGINLSVDSD